MREVIAGAAYIQGIGIAEGQHLLCSTITHLEEPLDLGKPQYLNASNSTYWSGITFPGLHDRHFNLTARDGYAAILSPDLVIDILDKQANITLAQVSSGTHHLMRSRGIYKSEWLANYNNTKQVVSDDEHFVLLLPMPNLESAAVVAIPRARMLDEVKAAAWSRLPIGLFIGLLLASLVYFIARKQLSIKSQLQGALKKREFFLLYQPVIDLQSGQCVGAEALMRWAKPSGRLVSPVVFIPAAEKCGLIQQITAQVMEMVAEDVIELIKNNPDFHIAINFSAEDLHSTEIEARLKNLIKLIAGDSNNIMIEATERGFMSPEKAQGVLVAVRSEGFKVAIDDFGTGNSSLSYLATYDLDFLKIDKMFVDSLGSDTPSSRVAFHIIEMARTLNLQMIAEGIESEEQSNILREAGVQFAQGWLFGKPMSVADLTEFVRTHNAPTQPSEVAPS
jgi:sensor c-di-GMP phosphodiesterase-like protein